MTLRLYPNDYPLGGVGSRLMALVDEGRPLVMVLGHEKPNADVRAEFPTTALHSEVVVDKWLSSLVEKRRSFRYIVENPMGF